MTVRAGLPSDALGLKVMSPDGTWTPVTGNEQIENLVVNPSFESVQPGSTVLRTNYMLNPSVEIDFTNWLNIGNATKTVERVSSDTALSGTHVLRVTRLAETGSLGHGPLTTTLQPGHYKVGLWIRGTVTGTPYLYVEGSATKTVKYHNGGAPLDPINWRLIWGVVEVTTAGNLKPGFLGGDGTGNYVEADGGFCYACNASDRVDPSEDFFDGDTTDELGWTYEWTETPGSSTSVVKASAVEVRKNLIINPSFESASGTVEVRRNLVTNPALFVDATGWSFGGTATSRSATGGLLGKPAIEIIRTASSVGVASSPPIPMTFGEAYSISALGVIPSGTEMALDIAFFNSAGTSLGTSTRMVLSTAGSSSTRVLVPADTPTRWEVEGVLVPADTATGRIRVFRDSGGDGTSYATDFLLEKASVAGGYFDGTTAASGDFIYNWVGNAHTSASIMQAPSLTSWTASATFYQSKIEKTVGSFSGGVKTKGANGDGFWPRIDIAVSASKTYTYSAWIKTTSAHSLTAAFRWKDSAGGTAGPDTNVSIGVVVGEWVWITATATSTATSAKVQVMLRVYETHTPTTFYVDGTMFVEGTYSGPYFDGSTAPSGDFSYSWVGDPNASTSIQQAPAVYNIGGNSDRKAWISADWALSGKSSVAVLAGVPNSDAFVGIPSPFPYGTSLAGRTFTFIGTIKTTETIPVVRDGRWWAFNWVANRPGNPAHSVIIRNNITTAGVHEVRGTFTFPTDVTTSAFLRLYNGSSTNGNIVWWDNIVIIEGTYTGPYFDGNTIPDMNYIYRWSGTPHASTSIGN